MQNDTSGSLLWVWERSQAPLERFMGPKWSYTGARGSLMKLYQRKETQRKCSIKFNFHGIYMVFALLAFWRFTDSIFYEFCMLT